MQDALARDMSVLVFCSTKKWCQQTANLLAKEVLSDRNRAAARESVAAAAAKKKSHGFAPAKSVALAAAGAAAAKSTEVLSREREGAAVSTTAKQHNGGAATTPTEKERGPEEGRRTASAEPASTADAVREKLRQTPVGLDAELSYLVRRDLLFFVSSQGPRQFIPS